MTKIELQNVSKSFGARKVLRDVSTTANPGECLVIAGHNGSGKSTLLKVVAGLLVPTSGQVQFHWEGVAQDRVQRRQYLGYVSPDLALYHDLSGVETLEFFGGLRGFAPSYDDLSAVLERVGLKGRGRDRVRSYSSGMRQRLKIACALLAQPPVLLLDEPSSNLDSDGVDRVHAIVKDQQERGGIVLLATNDPVETSWGDRIHPLGAQ
jgi:heme exporter protein A